MSWILIEDKTSKGKDDRQIKKQPSRTRMGEGEVVNGGHIGTNSCRSLYLKVTHQYFSGTKNESAFSYSSCSIRCVNASANKLEHLPPSSLSEESHSILQELYLTNNRLTDKCVPMLTGHTHLRVLHMAYNHLQTFPARWTTYICSSLYTLTCILQFGFTCWIFIDLIYTKYRFFGGAYSGIDIWERTVYWCICSWLCICIVI